MESRNYWRCFGDRFGAWEEKRLADRKWNLIGRDYAGVGQGEDIGVGKGRKLEDYLSVPTFLRRGIKLPV